MKIKLKKSIYFFTLLFSSLSLAQDTTWVQTFTYDSISTRRSVFDFPSSLNNKRFEKVLMYYNIKCSPLTPWDSYDCGEWDYLAYSQIHEHTNNFDSINVIGKSFSANYANPNSIDYNVLPYTLKDSYQKIEKNRNSDLFDLLSNFTLNSSNSVASTPYNLASSGSTYQVLLSASELLNSGMIAGDLQSLSLYINQILINGELKNPRISIKSTTNTELLVFETNGFTEVYNASHWMNGSKAELVQGENKFLFYQSFTWNGTDNLIIEFSYQDNYLHTNSLLFETENITSNTSIAYPDKNGAINFNANNRALLELSDFDLGDKMTIAFWAKGTGSAGSNTSILEAFDTLNNRVINIHFPWSDNRLYFDAGEGTGYDRIDKAMNVSTEVDNVWNHWAFVKDATSGSMKVYKNGTLWHSGTGKNLSLGHIHRFVLGSNWNFEYKWKGKMDEFQFFSEALSQTDIQTWMNKKIDASHPNWNNLLAYYDFDNTNYAEDKSINNNLLMPSEYNMLTFDEYPKVNNNQAFVRPVISFSVGTIDGTIIETEHPNYKLKEPTVVFEYQSVPRHFAISNAFVSILDGNEITYDINNQIINEEPYSTNLSLTNTDINYFNEPFELINNIEIGRYITPYGIGFDLGPNGFNYIYDVTDYQQYLKGSVDLEAHNTQELLDLKFVFIEGVPARDVHKREAIWSDFRSYQYNEMDNNSVLTAKSIQLSDTSHNFKIKTRFTGHGHNGSVNCCEWDSKEHQISVNGTPRFSWEIWQETECGDNPNIAQGGTWPYAREGWCPGDMVKEYDHELTPYVSSGQNVTLDYDIENVPINDQAQGNGNYVVAMDLISYSAPNFQHDATIIDILNPNNYEYYQKFNPTCSYPRVILQNTGALPLTQCTIRIYIDINRVIDYSWTGNLNFLQKEIVEIPITDLAWWYSLTGSHTFHAEIIGVENSLTGDEYENNNLKTTYFDSPEMISEPFYIWFTTNNKANENKYKLIKDNGEVVFERLSLTNSTQYKDTFNLAPGCYSIILEDTDNDGISFWYSAIPVSQGGEGETAGSFRLRGVTSGQTLETIDPDFGRYSRYNFSVSLEDLAIPDKNLNGQLNIFPNPSNGEFYIDLGGEINGFAKLQVLDLSGRIILNKEMNSTSNFAETTIDLSSNPSGFYTVKVLTGKQVYTKQLIKN
jgi:hypothetical protein